MTSFLAKIIGDTKVWKTTGFRATTASSTGMKSYMWRVTSDDGMDVAAFCDARLSGALTYVDRWRATLDRGVAAELAE